MIFPVSDSKSRSSEVGGGGYGGGGGGPIFRTGSVFWKGDNIIGAYVAEVFHKSPSYETGGPQSRKIT